jgi:hypothetical protein
MKSKRASKIGRPFYCSNGLLGIFSLIFYIHKLKMLMLILKCSTRLNVKTSFFNSSKIKSTPLRGIDINNGNCVQGLA